MAKRHKEIVKVQISLASSDGVQTVLVYTKDMADWYEGVAGAGVKKLMGRELKKYFYAWVPYESGQIEFLDEAPEQDW